MQRLMVFLGHPVYALGVVLFIILLFGGIGSTTVGAHPPRPGAVITRIVALLATPRPMQRPPRPYRCESLPDLRRQPEPATHEKTRFPRLADGGRRSPAATRGYRMRPAASRGGRSATAGPGFLRVRSAR